jgi:hypothetical protein
MPRKPDARAQLEAGVRSALGQLATEARVAALADTIETHFPFRPPSPVRLKQLKALRGALGHALEVISATDATVYIPVVEDADAEGRRPQLPLRLCLVEALRRVDEELKAVSKARRPKDEITRSMANQLRGCLVGLYLPVAAVDEHTNEYGRPAKSSLFVALLRVAARHHGLPVTRDLRHFARVARNP